MGGIADLFGGGWEGIRQQRLNKPPTHIRAVAVAAMMPGGLLDLPAVKALSSKCSREGVTMLIAQGGGECMEGFGQVKRAEYHWSNAICQRAVL